MTPEETRDLTGTSPETNPQSDSTPELGEVVTDVGPTPEDLMDIDWLVWSIERDRRKDG